MTPEQVKAARRLLGWSQSDLSGYADARVRRGAKPQRAA